MQGVTAICAFVGTGLLHSLHAQPHEILDVIWADLVVNLHLLSIARVGLLKQKLKKPEVVLICAHPYDQFDFNARFDKICNAHKKYPYAKCFGNYNVKMVPCYYHFVLRFLIYQALPSLFVDVLLRAIKIKPIAMLSQRKFFAGNKEIIYFLSKSYKSNGVTHLAELVLMSKESDFKIDSLFQQTNDVSVGKSYKAIALGNRRYLLKEDDSSLPAARKRFKM